MRDASSEGALYTMVLVIPPCLTCLTYFPTTFGKKKLRVVEIR